MVLIAEYDLMFADLAKERLVASGDAIREFDTSDGLPIGIMRFGAAAPGAEVANDFAAESDAAAGRCSELLP